MVNSTHAANLLSSPYVCGSGELLLRCVRFSIVNRSSVINSFTVVWRETPFFLEIILSKYSICINLFF